MSILNWLEEWYQSTCDSEREHLYGVKIDTLDNPGWVVRIDLADTLLQGKIFDNINIDNGDNDWIVCRVVNDIYEGFGDPYKLEKMLSVFKEWVEQNG
ncbi:MAG: immunity 53 family protein [Oscillospiraceae bacterium]|jgi:hypothetical protein|nr:immunity 53 family protein [Oscillospiraceae bacterium]